MNYEKREKINIANSPFHGIHQRLVDFIFPKPTEAQRIATERETREELASIARRLNPMISKYVAKEFLLRSINNKQLTVRELLYDRLGLALETAMIIGAEDGINIVCTEDELERLLELMECYFYQVIEDIDPDDDETWMRPWDGWIEPHIALLRWKNFQFPDPADKEACRKFFTDVYYRAVEGRCRPKGLSKEQAISSVNLEVFLTGKAYFQGDENCIWQYVPKTFDHATAEKDAIRLGLIDPKRRQVTKLGRAVLVQNFDYWRMGDLEPREELGIWQISLALEHSDMKLRLNEETGLVEMGYFPESDEI